MEKAIKKTIEGLMDSTINKEELTRREWEQISAYRELSEAFIHQHEDKVDWWMVSMYQKLSEGFIRRYADRVDWERVSGRQKLSEECIHQYADRVSWDIVCESQRLSEEFIHGHAGQVDWHAVSAYQKLSEGFIRQHAGQVNWQRISRYQPLSEVFIEEFGNQVDWRRISEHQYLSDAFIQAHKNQLYIHLVRNNWAYKTPEELEQAVRDTGLYECHKGYFIAYKGIRSDRYSCYNFQYHYMPGETYETFADCSDKEDSFGFSVWTKGYARNYCNELVIPCRIEYQDVARVMYDDGGKIRCRKLTVLA